MRSALALPAATPSWRGVAIAIAIALHAAGILLVLELGREPKPPAPPRALSLVDLDVAPPPPAPRLPPPAAEPAEPTAAPIKPAAPTTPAKPAAPAAHPMSSAPKPPAPSEPDYLPQYRITDVPVIPAAEILSRIEYPPMAAREGIEATVYLELYIDQSGVIRKVLVLKDPGYGFADAAVKAVEGVVATPARADGKPVAVRFRYAVRFTLR